MKTAIYLFLGITLLGFTSCKTGFENFNRQKFTALKKVKPVKESNEEFATKNLTATFYDLPDVHTEIDTIPIKNAKHYTTLDQTEIELIQQAISSGRSIIVKKGGKYFEIKNPVYDSFYEAVIGKAVPIASTDLPREYLQIETEEMEIGSGDSYLYLKNVKSVKMMKLREEPLIEEQEKTEKKEHVVQQEDTESVARLKTEQSKLAKSARKAHLTALVSIGVMLIAIFLLIVTTFPIFWVVCAIGFLLGFIARIIGLVKIRKYRKFSEKHKLEQEKDLNMRRTLMILGIILQLVPVVLIGVLMLIIMSTF
ncbi:MAG: hypothetical protein WDZ35_01385 [Crocinitomicaceae bacterium]